MGIKNVYCVVHLTVNNILICNKNKNVKEAEVLDRCADPQALFLWPELHFQMRSHNFKVYM